MILIFSHKDIYKRMGKWNATSHTSDWKHTTNIHCVIFLQNIFPENPFIFDQDGLDQCSAIILCENQSDRKSKGIRRDTDLHAASWFCSVSEEDFGPISCAMAMYKLSRVLYILRQDSRIALTLTWWFSAGSHDSRFSK